MAKLENGILGGFRGKVGNVIGYTYKGQNVIRKYQPVVTNPKTTQQTASRSRFRTLSQLWTERYNDLQLFNYGTMYTAVYQRVLQQFLNSAVGKSVNANIAQEQRGSTTAIFAYIDKAPIDYYNSIAGCYSEQELNVFAPNYLQVGSKGAHLINNIYQCDVSFGGVSKYFGTDVPIPQAVNAISLTASVRGLKIEVTPIVFRQQSTVVVADGLKNRGFYGTAVECGSGWKYIYLCDGEVAIPTLYADCSFVDVSGVRNIWQIACSSIVFAKNVSGGTALSGIDLIANISMNQIDSSFPTA